MKMIAENTSKRGGLFPPCQPQFSRLPEPGWNPACIPATMMAIKNAILNHAKHRFRNKLILGEKKKWMKQTRVRTETARYATASRWRSSDRIALGFRISPICFAKARQFPALVSRVRKNPATVMAKRYFGRLKTASSYKYGKHRAY